MHNLKTVKKPTFLLLILLLLWGLSVASAQDVPESISGDPLDGPVTFDPSEGRRAVESIRATSLLPNAQELVGAPIQEELLSQTGSVGLIVKLSGAPAIERAGFDALSGVSAMSAVAAEQSSAISAVSAFGNVTGSVQLLTNAIFVTTDANNVDDIANLPGVAGVYLDEMLERTHTTSMPYIDADDAWTGLGVPGVTGEGVIISVIDTGIDYTHTMFGGNGDFATGAGDTTVVETTGTPATLYPAPLNPTGRGPKVIGGYDFVGDDYGVTGIPVEDPDPVDCPVADGGGHGSHVAGSAAGYGVAPDGSTYAGPYDNTIFPEFPDADVDDIFSIGPGVAPEAMLMSMRVFACTGGTATSNVLAAIEASVSGVDGQFPQADVINMSLGSDFTSGDPDNPRSQTVFNAIAAGTTVVVAAGNDSDFHYITGPTGVAEAITVANITDTTAIVRGSVIRNNGDGAPVEYIAPAAAFGPDVTLTGDVVYAVPANGCGSGPLDNADAIAGNIALIDRGACAFVDKVARAIASGASGVLVANNAEGSPITMGGSLNSDIPARMISLADGNDVKQYLDIPVNVTFNPDGLFINPETPGLANNGTSRGPSNFRRTSFGPHVGAPGTTITSARAGAGTSPYTISGTSMASPHIAGVAALVLERWPNWTPQQVKARVMNSGLNNVTDSSGNLHGPQRVGSGLIDVDAALANPVIAYHRDDPTGASVSFGTVEGIAGQDVGFSPAGVLSAPAEGGTDPLVTGAGFSRNQRVITVQNLGNSSATYNAQVLQRTDVPGVSFSISPSSVTVPANGTAEITVTIAGDLNQPNVNAQNDPTRSIGFPDQVYLTEETAVVELTNSANGDRLRVPVYANARVASDMRADEVLIAPSSGITSVSLTGTGVNTGAGGNNIRSKVMGFTPVVTDHPNDPNVSDYHDIRAVGINDASFGITGLFENSQVLFFAIETYEEWGTMHRQRFQIHLNVLDDSVSPGYEFTYAVGAIQFGDDRNVVAVFDNFGLLSGSPGALLLATGSDLIYPNGVIFAEENTYSYETTVVVVPVITFVAPNSIIDYYIEAGDFNPSDPDFLFELTETVGSAASPLTYRSGQNPYFFDDAFAVFVLPRPSSVIPMFDDVPGGIVPVEYYIDEDTAPDGTIPDIMLVHFHNADDSQVGRVEYVTPTTVETANLSVTKTGDKEFALNEELVTFTITVTNNSNTPAGDVTMVDTLPATMTHSSNSCDTIGGVVEVTTQADGTTAVACFVGGMLPGETAEMTVSAFVNIDAPFDGSLIENTVTVSSAQTEQTPEDNTASFSFCNSTEFECNFEAVAAANGGSAGGTGTGTTTGGAAGILSGTFTDLSGQATFAQRGGAFRYTFTINNTTGTPLQNALMQADFSAGVTLSNPSASAGSVSISNGGSAQATTNRLVMGAPDLLEQSGSAGPTLTYTNPVIGVGEVVTVSVDVNVPATYSSAFVTVNAALSANGGTLATISQIVPLVAQLPATGEEPIYRELVLLALAGTLIVLLAVGFVAINRRRYA